MVALLANYHFCFKNTLFSRRNVLFYDRSTDYGTEMLLHSSQGAENASMEDFP